ncbi:uncharacterized protein LOC144331603 [Macaca mulatta]
MFFSLTASGPASLRPFLRLRAAGPVATARLGICRSCLAPCTRVLCSEPRPAPAGREAGWGQAGSDARVGRSCLALPSFVPASSVSLRSNAPPPRGLLLGPAAGPAARRAPTLRPLGVPSPSGPPAPGLRSCWCPGRPAPSSVLCVRPTLLPELGGEPGTVPGCLGAQPGQGELSGEGWSQTPGLMSSCLGLPVCWNYSHRLLGRTRLFSTDKPLPL